MIGSVEQWIFPAAGALIALVVWWDAQRLGIRFGGPNGRNGSIGGPGWVALMVIAWPAALPTYAYRRRQWLPPRPR